MLSASCDASTNVATFSWTQPSGATSYNVRVNDTAYAWDGTCTSPGNWCFDGLTSSSKQITGLYAVYNSWLEACNAGGCSPVSNHATADCTPPALNCTLSADPSNLSGPGTVTLTAAITAPGWSWTSWTGTLTDVAYKVVVTRLGNKLRGAGTAELAGYDLRLRPARCATIAHVLADLFPGACDLAQAQYWCGLRPMTPDNSPVKQDERNYRGWKPLLRG